MSEERVYHYTSAKTAIEHILKDSKLRMSQFGETNDPFESLVKSISSSIPRSDFPVATLAECESNFQLICARTKVVSFSQDIASTGEEVTSGEKILNKGYAFSRMWAQYGDKNRGVCFGFDKEAIYSAAKKSLLVEQKVDGEAVIYSNEMHRFFNHSCVHQSETLNLKGGKEIAEEMIKNKHIFFRKYADWRDENEYRIIYSAEFHNDYEYIDFGDALKTIYLGCKMTREDKSEIKRIVKNLA